MLLIALALLPLAGLVLDQARVQRNVAVETAKSDALHLARVCANDHARLIESCRQLLITLAQTEPVQTQNGPACGAIFAQILSKFPTYVNIGLLDAEGNVLASGVRFEQPLNLSTRRYFKRALARRDFALGDFQVGRITHKPTLNAAFPLLDQNQQVRSVLFAALDLNWFNEVARRLQLPHSATMSVVDQNGTTLARYPEPERWVGQPAMPEAAWHMAGPADQKEVTTEAPGADGVERFYARTSLALADGEQERIWVNVSLPKKGVFTEANRAMTRHFWLLALLAALAFVAAWFLADRLVLGGVQTLLRTTEKVTAGDLSARVTGRVPGQELGRLAAAFNAMASSLENRVAELIAAESALKKSEALFRSLFEFSPMAIFVEDEIGTVLDANPAACRLQKLTRSELVGQSVLELVPPAHRAEVERTFPQWLSGSLETKQGETRASDGSVIPVEVLGTRIDYGGRPAVLLHVRDITARRDFEARLRLSHDTMEKRVVARTAELAQLNTHLEAEIAERQRAEAALRESAERFEIVMRGTHDGVWDWNLMTNEIYFSRRWKTMLGYEYDEIEDRYAEWEKRMHPEDRERALTTIRSYLDGQLPAFELEHRLQHKDGGYRWILSRGVALRDETGKPYRMAGSNVDLTARRAAEEELRQLHQFMDSIVENIPNMVFVKDARDLRYVRFNKAGEELTGLKREDLLGETDFAFFPQEEAESFAAQDRATLQSRQLYDIGEDQIHTRARGVRFLHTKKIPIFDASGEPQYLLGISEDITVQKQAREELRRTTEELKRSNRELEQFAYVASHDLQEPLRMVASYTQLLQRRYGAQLDETAREFMEFAADGAQRMQQFISDLLAYSRVGARAQSMQKVELSEIFAAAVTNLTVAIEESGAEVSSAPLPAVRGEPRQLTQLFQNLISNGLKFHGDAPPRVRVSAERENGWWRLAVSDHGLGIEPEFFERIFVIFQRLHSREEYAGTGIGLAICQKIVEGHGGRIWVESTPGQGTTFYCTLPAAEGRA